MHPQPRREPPHPEKDATASGRTAAGERLRLLELAAEHVDEVILISEAEPIDLPGPRVLYVNSAFTRMTGYAPEEIIGKTPRLLQGPGTSPETRAFIRERLSQWEGFTCELLNHRKDGGQFWVELSVTPVADETGWYTHWVSVQRNITDRKREERLRDEVLTRYELAVAGSQSGVWSWDVVTGERYRSDHWKSILGYVGPFEAEAPDDPAAVTHPEDLARRESELIPPFLSDDAPDFVWEYRARHRDGSWRWMESRARAERDVEGRALRVAGTYSDITERKRGEEERRERAERDRRVADVLQATVLPPLPERPVPGLLVGGFHEPASDEAAIGGDFYDCFPLPGGRVALVVGDVIGHGLAAALSIAEVRFALRGFLSEDGLDDPAAALRRLNRFLSSPTNCSTIGATAAGRRRRTRPSRAGHATRWWR
jgi:PAS domain S-box-containing protein